jgi:hypothetical protein
MTQANDSITVTPGSGATVATHLVSSKEHQVFIAADDTGHLIGSRPKYFVNIAATVHVASANTVMWDLFNGDASLVVRVTSIKQIPDMLTAVTGVAFSWLLERSTTVGTGGTAQTPWLADTAQTALDADITCRLKPSGGATAGTDLRNYQIHSEETNAGTMVLASLGGFELVPDILRPPISEQGIVLRPGEGLRCVQITNSAAGNTGWFIGFTVE